MRSKNNKWRIKVSLLSRGEEGMPVNYVHRLALDEQGNWRKAVPSKDRPEDTLCWGIFDPEWGWFPFDGFIDD